MLVSQCNSQILSCGLMGKKIKSEILGHSGTFPLLGESESVAKYGDWLGICALHLIHPSVNTHTTGAVGSHLAAAHREQLGVRCLTLVIVLRAEESAGYLLPPPTIPAGPETRTRNLRVTRPTLTIRPPLPHMNTMNLNILFSQNVFSLQCIVEVDIFRASYMF